MERIIMERDYITIAGINNYYGVVPFEPGNIVKLMKEPSNCHDTEAICATLPYVGKIGYVANSVNTVVKGTHSAGRIYDRFNEVCFARVKFILTSFVICEVIFSNDIDGMHANIIESMEKQLAEWTKNNKEFN